MSARLTDLEARTPQRLQRRDDHHYRLLRIMTPLACPRAFHNLSYYCRELVPSQESAAILYKFST